MSGGEAVASIVAFIVILWLALSAWASLAIVRAWLREVREADRRAGEVEDGWRVDW